MTAKPRKPSDSRCCWDCLMRITLPGVDDINKVDRYVRRLGWRYLEWRGRMVCRGCYVARFKEATIWRDADLPW